MWFNQYLKYDPAKVLLPKPKKNEVKEVTPLTDEEYERYLAWVRSLGGEREQKRRGFYDRYGYHPYIPRRRRRHR